MPFCTHCGLEADAAARFCSRCGTPVAAPPGPPRGTPPRPSAPQVAPDIAALGPAPRAGSPTVAWLVGIGALVLVLVGVGVFILVRGGSGGDTITSGLYGETALPAPMASEPEEIWSRDNPGDGVFGVPFDDLTIIASLHDDGSTATDIVAIDNEGEDLWSLERETQYYVAGWPDDESVVLLLPAAGVIGGEASDIDAVSTEDGSVRWSVGAGSPIRFTDEGVLLSDDEGLHLVGRTDGDTRWEVLDAGPSYAVNQDNLLVVDDDTLTAYSLGSGDEEWSIDHGLGCGDLACRVAASDEVVLVANTQSGEATAFDAGDGAELWDEHVGEDDLVGAVGPSLVFIQSSPDTGDGADGAAVFFDREGQRGGEIEIDADLYYFTPFGVVHDGSSYVVDWTSGTLYGEDLDEVRVYDGVMTFVDGGLYVAGGQEVSFVPFGETDPRWTLPVSGELRQLYGHDRGLVLITSEAITRYE